MPEAEQPASVASRSNPTALQRRVGSRIMRLLLSRPQRDASRGLRELSRRLRGAPHRVHYFHQVDDPYSHLAAQALGPLCERYEIELVPHVAATDTGPNLPEPELLANLARRDCAAVAPHYGLAFPPLGAPPPDESLRLAERLLVAARTQGPQAFASLAVQVGRALWEGDEGSLKELSATRPSASEAEARRELSEACELRRKHRHYSGATFLHSGEWFWGVDRLHHLERRLTELGASRSDRALLFPRPAIPMEPVPRASELSLEVYPSLRSPYTAIAFAPTLRLAERSGIQLVVRPVLPMVMRGVPATFAKGIYIATDALRESEALGTPFGRLVDPIGEPVRRAYSLWPFAVERGKGNAFLAAFLRAAWAEGVDTSADAGLRRVVETAGLSWAEARPHLGDPAWEPELEDNRLAMVGELGQWGVPSYRLAGPAGEPDLCCWGQDRLWLIGREIQRRGHLPAGD